MLAPPGQGHPVAEHWYKLVIPDRRSLDVYCKAILHDGVVTPACLQTARIIKFLPLERLCRNKVRVEHKTFFDN